MTGSRPIVIKLGGTAIAEERGALGEVAALARERDVIVRHALKNALNPVVTLLGLQLVALLSGAILVENIFAWPGVGRYVFTAIQMRDYPVVQGTVLLIALLYVAVNTAIDLVYGIVDPRIRGSAQGGPA